ncbi:hypothetical protein [Methylocystis rosea]|uniref:Uncharacterized protein n=1 Tax=Methylocystis rosea TaxID=173366 RepID=A0A3G8M3M4_9HYPH|nr:hypothetical protein [Methylocystis rosea]AZG76307.1 hypothetical protein EHO51_05955 [Methylocystis rosea]
MTLESSERGDSFTHPPPQADEVYISKIQQQASVALWHLIHGANIRPGDEIRLNLSVVTARGEIHDRRVLRAPDKIER